MQAYQPRDHEAMNLKETPFSESLAGADLNARALTLFRPVLIHDRFAVAAPVFLSELAAAFACERACLGFLIGRGVKIVAISQHHQPIERPVLPEVTSAMDEAILQGVSLIYPPPSGEFPHITVAHAELARRHGMSRILTIPLVKNEQLIGAITLEWRQSGVLNPGDVSFIEKLAVNVGPLLQLKWRMDQPLWSRSIAVARDVFLGVKGGPSPRFRVAAALCTLALLLGLVVVPVPHRVSGQARLEASIQRVITAPMDGYLKEIHVRPGDHVKANQLLAELNDDTLRVQRRQIQTEAVQHENALAEAMVKGDRTQMAISRAKLDEIMAQVELADHQLAHTRLVAPFDGIVINGDLAQLLGAPLKRSDTLLTLSQGEDFKVIIDVDEREISDVRIGQKGTLALTSFPDERFAIRVVRITPLATASDGRNNFEVEAVIESDASALTPGLKGVAKVGTNTQPAAWKWIARFWHKLTFIAWSWLG
jgi:RND family efflux transporter MFP subunit